MLAVHPATFSKKTHALSVSNPILTQTQNVFQRLFPDLIHPRQYPLLLPLLLSEHILSAHPSQLFRRNRSAYRPRSHAFSSPIVFHFLLSKDRKSTRLNSSHSSI